MCRKWRAMPPSDQSQNCRCKSLNWGLGKGWGMERTVVVVGRRMNFILKARFLDFTLAAILLYSCPCWDLQALGLEIWPLSELSRKLHELVYE